MIDRRTDHELSDRLTRAIGHTIAEFCRRFPETSAKAVMAAIINNVITVGQTMGARLKDIKDSLVWGWGEEISPAPPDAAGSAESASPPA